jgi:hypothetical protein
VGYPAPSEVHDAYFRNEGYKSSGNGRINSVATLLQHGFSSAYRLRSTRGNHSVHNSPFIDLLGK